jgi:activating signal cointegrator complex subunit 1
MFQAVQSRMLDYSHFISLPLAIHSDLVNKLNRFQSSILGASASHEDSDKDESLSEGSIDEMDYGHMNADSSSVSIKLQVKEEETVRVKINTKGSLSGLKASHQFPLFPCFFCYTFFMELWCYFKKCVAFIMFETYTLACLECPKKCTKEHHCRCIL